MSGSRGLRGLRSRPARVGLAMTLAILGAAATAELTAALVAQAPVPIRAAVPAATVADPSCGGLITLVCGSESHNET